ncbi:MAG: hypothetical protein FJX47_05745 [Alphaproteobacteria bacterium]|nr:hypothetical protein [Alphaproteobacteria bacterium]
MQAGELVIVALLILACGLAGAAMFAAGKVRSIIEESIRGGSEQTGNVRNALVETKKAIANLNATIEAINAKIKDHDQTLHNVRTTIEEVRKVVKPPDSGR